MKHRVKKRRLYSRLQGAVLLPKRFVNATRHELAEARAGKVTLYVSGTNVRKKVRPVALDLSGADGTRRVMDAAQRVIATHAAVLDALAQR